MDKVHKELSTIVGRKIVKVDIDATYEGLYTIYLDDGRAVSFSAVGDDMTYCTVEIRRY